VEPEPVFYSKEIVAHFPVGNAKNRTQVSSKGVAILECKEWLEKEFSNDPEKKKSKTDFRSIALARFHGRISQRGFDNSVWPELAQKYGRNQPGAKKKS